MRSLYVFLLLALIGSVFGKAIINGAVSDIKDGAVDCKHGTNEQFNELLSILQNNELLQKLLQNLLQKLLQGLLQNLLQGLLYIRCTILNH